MLPLFLPRTNAVSPISIVDARSLDNAILARKRQNQCFVLRLVVFFPFLVSTRFKRVTIIEFHKAQIICAHNGCVCVPLECRFNVDERVRCYVQIGFYFYISISVSPQSNHSKYACYVYYYCCILRASHSLIIKYSVCVTILLECVFIYISNRKRNLFLVLIYSSGLR